MSRFLPDTSVLIALCCTWHEQHESAIREWERRLVDGDKPVFAAPALVEAYAVLTRLPPPHRLSPADALTVLETNFLAGTTVVALDASAYSLLLHDAPGHGVSGGQTYDWVIASCAVKAKATVLLTFNAKDFRALAIEGLDILVPAAV